MNIYVQQYGSSCSTVIVLRLYIAMKTKEAGHVIKDLRESEATAN